MVEYSPKQMREVIITPSPEIGLKKSKSLSLVGKERFLKSVGVKNNHENIMKSNDRISFHHGSENDNTCFLGVIL